MQVAATVVSGFFLYASIPAPSAQKKKEESDNQPSCQIVAGDGGPPLVTYMIPAEGLGGRFIDDAALWHGTMAKLGWDIPPALNAEYLGGVAGIESSSGARAYSVGNSYTSLFGFAADLDARKSHLAQNMNEILVALNAARSNIPVLNTPALKGCGQITKEIILSGDIRHDPTIQAFFLLSTSLKAYNVLSQFKNFRGLSSDQQQATLYLYHNLPQAALTTVKNLHLKSDKKLVDLLATESKINMGTMTRFLVGNPKVYPPNVTPRELLKHVARLMHPGTMQVKNFNPDNTNDSRAIKNFLDREDSFFRQMARTATPARLTKN